MHPAVVGAIVEKSRWRKTGKGISVYLISDPQPAQRDVSSKRLDKGSG